MCQSFSFRSASSAPLESLTLCLLPLRDCHPPFRWRSISDNKLLTLQNAAVFAPLMILVPARQTVNGPQFASHPYPAVFAALTRRRK